MDIISSKNVISIVRKALNLIDERLINHGERVSYILYKMLECESVLTQKEILMNTIVALFHDIGAYKNEEVDQMLQFETNNAWGHSIYGYLFLKYLSPLGDYADAVLYHHLDYEKLKQLNSKNESIAEYLNLADRIDVTLKHSQERFDFTLFEERRNSTFSGEALDLFQKTEEKYQIVEHIKNNTYLEEMNQVFEEAIFDAKEKEKFLKMLIYSIDFRSEYTVMHTIITVSVSDEIGRLIKLEENDQVNLHFGSLLHDIGKISIPISILEAPRRLTSEEMKIMRQHVQMSEFILKDYINSDILEIAIRHHEKLDGSGYHKGLSGNQLTIPQRILAVADIISALYGVRSYKNSFGKEKILKILTSDAEKGKICRFVVDCVLNNYDELIEKVENDTSESLLIYSDIKMKYDELYKQFLELV